MKSHRHDLKEGDFSMWPVIMVLLLLIVLAGYLFWEKFSISGP